MEPFRLPSCRRLGPVANVEANADRDADLQHLQLFYHKTAARERGQTYVCREESFPQFRGGRSAVASFDPIARRSGIRLQRSARRRW